MIINIEIDAKILIAGLTLTSAVARLLMICFETGLEVLGKVIFIVQIVRVDPKTSVKPFMN